MERKLTMLDYVKMANARMRENLARGEELVEPLVSAYLGHLADNGDASVRIVASGSSRNAAECARTYLQAMLGVQVLVVTPESFVAYDHAYPADAFNVVVSQSGYSTNVLAALGFCREQGLSCTALTGNPESPMKEHTSVVLDYGVGVESVDFVTMGVATLALYFMLFGLYGAKSLGQLADAQITAARAQLESALDSHAAVVEAMPAYLDKNRLDVARSAPAMLVGNGCALGVAQEAALKFQETLKWPAMAFEGEEFAHGPEMQVAPGYHVCVMDDAAGSPRLATAAATMARITSSTVFLTMHPTGAPWEFPVPPVKNPLTACLPYLAFFQYVAAAMTAELNRWDVHPYLDACAKDLDTKAGGYEDAVRSLETKAQSTYQNPTA